MTEPFECDLRWWYFLLQVSLRFLSIEPFVEIFNSEIGLPSFTDTTKCFYHHRFYALRTDEMRRDEMRGDATRREMQNCEDLRVLTALLAVLWSQFWEPTFQLNSMRLVKLHNTIPGGIWYDRIWDDTQNGSPLETYHQISLVCTLQRRLRILSDSSHWLKSSSHRANHSVG